MNREQILRTIRIIQLSMAAATAIFSGLIVFVYFSAPPTWDIQKPNPVPIFSVINGIMFVVMWMLGPILLKIMRQAAPTQGKNPAMSPEVTAAVKWQAHRLVVLATREGSAMFGLVACLLGAKSGVLAAHPIYWLNALPAAAMIRYAISNLPTEADMDRESERDGTTVPGTEL